jgi:uncharacterized protein (TIGR02145 family)
MSSLKLIFPTGWHLPTDEEWSALTTYLGGISDAAGKMKETGTSHWYSPNTGATNSTGFSGLPGGKRWTTGFQQLSYHADFWATSSDPVNAWYRQLHYLTAQIYRTYTGKIYGKSVGCLKN